MWSPCIATGEPMQQWRSSRVKNANRPGLLELLMSGCQFLATDWLVWNGIRQHFLKAPRIFLVGSQGCEPFPEGLESLPFIKSALRGFDILYCLISLPRLIGNGGGVVGSDKNGHWIIPCRTCPTGKMEKDGHGRKHEGSCWADFVVNHCGSG